MCHVKILGQFLKENEAALCSVPLLASWNEFIMTGANTAILNHEKMSQERQNPKEKEPEFPMTP